MIQIRDNFHLKSSLACRFEGPCKMQVEKKRKAIVNVMLRLYLQYIGSEGRFDGPNQVHHNNNVSDALNI